MTDHRAIRVCFVSPKAGHALSGRREGVHIGGAEVQQVLIARGLLERGYEVSFVVLDDGRTGTDTVDGITVHKTYRPDAGWPGLRFLHPRITRLWSALARADADVYYQRTSDTTTGVVAMFCRAHGRKFVFGVAHDADTTPELMNCPTRRERFLYLYGLRRADVVVAQTKKQHEALKHHFDRGSIIIANVMDPDCWQEPSVPPESTARPVVLWVARFAPHKRLEWVFQIARACPEMDFRVCGDGHDAAYVSRLREEASCLPNVEMLGAVPRDQMWQHYREASVLLCTSGGEGFPNTFLEAWAFGVPVVTSFDPDDRIQSGGLGLVAGTIEDLSQALRELLGCEAKRKACIGRARAYVSEHHSLPRLLDAYDRTLRDLVR